MTILELGRIAFSLAAVLGLIGVLAYGARMAGVGDGVAASNRKRRLKVVESLPLDSRRRLAIVRCDEREHLIVLNASSVSVIERAIPSPDATAPNSAPAPEAPNTAEMITPDPKASPEADHRETALDRAIVQLLAVLGRLREAPRAIARQNRAHTNDDRAA